MNKTEYDAITKLLKMEDNLSVWRNRYNRQEYDATVTASALGKIMAGYNNAIDTRGQASRDVKRLLLEFEAKNGIN